MSKKAKGNRAEQLAVTYLQTQGAVIRENNFRIDGGEIDIIAQQQQIWLFVEVKYRADEQFAALLDQITAAQCRRIRFAAQCYFLFNEIDQHKAQIRFDVIAVTGSPSSIYWLKDAF
ncbi:MAG: YraN family protein [Pseudomonadota bacterium]